MNQARVFYQRVFGFAVALSLIYITSPLIFPIIMGGVISVLFFPWLKALEKRGLSPFFSSLVVTTLVTFLFILPVSFLVFLTIRTVSQLVIGWKSSLALPVGEGIGGWFRSAQVEHWVARVKDFLPFDLQQVSGSLQEVGLSLGGKLTELLAEFFSQLPGLVMSLLLTVLSIYFCFLDGRRLLILLRKQSFFNSSQTEKLIQTLADVCRSVLLAAIVAGLFQSGLAILVLALTGTPQFGIIGVCVFFGSFIPLVGAAPITFGIALHQFFIAGRHSQGLILLVTAIFISTLDNLIRPLFLKGSVNLHPLLAFVAALGGLQTIGFLGIFLGPILAALFVATFEVLTEKSSQISPE